MAQGERDIELDATRVVGYQRLRIRTVAVSFAAAVSSARRDLDLAPAERDALVELWRTWSLEQLAGYAADLDALERDRPDLADGVTALRATLTDSIERVRGA